MNNSNESNQKLPHENAKNNGEANMDSACIPSTNINDSIPHSRDQEISKNEESKDKHKANHDRVEKQFSFQGQKLTNQLDEFERKGSKGNKKNKKGFKWNKGSSYKDLLGFDEFGTSPFDQDRGYNLNELEYVHFTERPIRRARAKSAVFSSAEHVQANHRFILKPNRNQDYFFVTYDPDYSLEWDDIFMVHAKRNTQYICPI